MVHFVAFTLFVYLSGCMWMFYKQKIIHLTLSLHLAELYTGCSTRNHNIMGSLSNLNYTFRSIGFVLNGCITWYTIGQHKAESTIPPLWRCTCQKLIFRAKKPGFARKNTFLKCAPPKWRAYTAKRRAAVLYHNMA